MPSNLACAFPTAQPMRDRPEILKCNHCKRAVGKHAVPLHVKACLNKKQEKQRKKKEAKDARDAAARKEASGTAGASEVEDDDGAKKSTANKTGIATSKKRKAGEADDDTAPAKKKKKKEEPKKPPKAKAPIDVEKQCGVELPAGGQCARSLTCKSHSMGAKRAVPNRSAPYDKLLMEYQRKNQAKLQKAQFDANAPNPEDDHLPSGPVDSEEERDAVMSAIARNWGGAPLYERVPVPLRSRYRHHRIKDMLQSALSGSGSGSGSGGSGTGAALFGGPSKAGGFFGSAPVSLLDDHARAHAHPHLHPHPHPHALGPARRPSVMPPARTLLAATSRKASAAGP